MDELETYARAAARLAGIEVEAAWWPAVVRHLGVLLDRAAVVEAAARPAPAARGPAGGAS